MSALVCEATFRDRLERLESWLFGSGFAQLGLGAAPPSDAALADRVLELSDLYTLRREQLAEGAVRSSHLLARTLYFLCADAPKVHLILAELVLRGAYAPPRRLVVRDFGSGVGATAVGVLLSLPAGATVTLVGIDEDPDCAEIWNLVAHAAAEIAEATIEVESRCGDLFDALPVGDGDQDVAPLTICQAALNERLGVEGTGADATHDSRTIELVRRWCAAGPTILIEPALRIATRPLQRLRDALLCDESIAVLAPCPHRAACPMLASPRDWCHEIRRWRPTPRVDAIQRLTRRRDERLKFSFMAFAAASSGAGLAKAAPATARLVSDPLVTKGKTERVVCVADGTLRKLRLLDRERTEATAALADLPRGTLLTIDGMSETDRVGGAMQIDRWRGSDVDRIT